MTPERMRFLILDQNAKLTQEELAEGWRFCCEWDGMLIQKGDPEADVCSCLNHNETSPT